MGNTVMRRLLYVTIMLCIIFGLIYTFTKGDGHKYTTYNKYDVEVKNISDIRPAKDYVSSFPDYKKYEADVTYISKDNTDFEAVVVELSDTTQNFGYNNVMYVNSKDTKDYKTISDFVNFVIFVALSIILFICIIVLLINDKLFFAEENINEEKTINDV